MLPPGAMADRIVADGKECEGGRQGGVTIVQLGNHVPHHVVCEQPRIEIACAQNQQISRE
jgi:hypothetical protein